MLLRYWNRVEIMSPRAELLHHLIRHNEVLQPLFANLILHYTH